MKSATIYATGACNLRCKHCSVGLDHHQPRAQLNSRQLNAAISNLRTSGVDTINLLGGEVTIYRNDLKEIYKHCSDIGTKVSINTNLTDIDQIQDIISERSFYVAVVSLDGLSSRTHNLLRGKGQFKKTARNLVWLIKERARRKLSFEVHVTFVINKFNKDEAVYAIKRLARLGVDKVNFNHLMVGGRAKLFESKISLSDADIVETTAKIAACWLLYQRVDLEIYISPALAIYLEKRWRITSKLMTKSACGGPIDSYGYIDLKGNHLPCPAMAVEENQRSSLNSRNERLDIVNNPASQIWSQSIFRGFEKRRASRKTLKEIFPCSFCNFSSECSPCTAPLIKGELRPEIRTCASLYRYMQDQNNWVDGIFCDSTPNHDDK